MAIEVGSVLNGTVSGITKFGAFIDLGDKTNRFSSYFRSSSWLCRGY